MFMPDSSKDQHRTGEATERSEPGDVAISDRGEVISTPARDVLFPVVGIGASAGGLEAFRQFLKSLPSDSGMAFVLVQHLNPSHESMLVHLLAPHTSMSVQQAEQWTKVEPDHVYIIPPNTQMAIRQGVLELSPRTEERRPNLPIDHFFSSLALDQRSRSVGVVLSGVASDGTLGLEAIKEAGGVTFAQDESARFDGMPRSAISAGAVDFVLSAEDIGSKIVELANHPHFGARQTDGDLAKGPELDKVFTFLQSRTGVDFTHYKMPTIRRRLSRRMVLRRTETLKDYLALLEREPSESNALFDDLLITVTEFFRDSETFDALAEKVFPAMLEERSPDEAIRIWVPGCSVGKEVYSVAIALLEYLERVKRSFPIQIFGTDVSERSIEFARAGKYPDSISATVSPERLKRFFMKVDGSYQVTRTVRDLCIFSRQDLTRDPPLAKMDLISCRNLLIYLGPVLQRRVLSIFSYALMPKGCLLLGSSESIGSLTEYFVPLDPKHKFYCRNLSVAQPHFDLPAQRPGPYSIAASTRTKNDDSFQLDRLTDRMLLDKYAPSGFLIDDDFRVVKFRGDVGPYLSPPPGDPDLEIFQLVREDISHPLQSALQEARNGDREVRRDSIRVHRNDGFRDINLVAWPVTEPMAERHFLVLLEETEQAEHRRQIEEHEVDSSQGHQNLISELASTRAYMQRLVEDLRGANEEAQSSNEELQSTNEELQTAKEELQSSNEELITANEEMQGRNSELNQTNNDLVNLLSSMQMPIVMLTSELRIRRYTPAAESVLKLIPTDIGRPISDLKTRIDVPDLEDLLTAVSRSGEPYQRDVRHESGRWFSLRIHPYKTSSEHIDGAVLQLLDIDQLKNAMSEVEDARDYAESIIKAVREPLVVLDEELRVQTANRAFFETFHLSQEQISNRSIYEIDEARWKLPMVSRLLQNLKDDESHLEDVELEREVDGLGTRNFQLNAHHLRRSQEQDLILLALQDVTDRKKTAEAKYRRLFETAQDGIVIVDAETGEITDLNPFVGQMLGMNRGAAIGKPFWTVAPLSQLPNGEDILKRLQRDKVVRLPELSLKRSDDQKEIQAEIIANLYAEGAKDVAQFNIRDITERKQFDQQLQQTARLESLGILAGGIAHDFNNLLSGILGNAGLALGEAPPDSPYQSALKNVVHASQRAAELTRQMLAYAGKGRLNVRPLDLSDLVKETSKLVEISVPKSVQLRLDLARELPMVAADAGQMQQVLMNLVINGAESIGEGRDGFVCVSTRQETLSAEDLRTRYASTDLPAGSYVALDVTDNGSGMDEQVRQRIFDPFFTTKFAGRGLGLSAVQGIVRGHRGTIQVSSVLGKGSTFSMLLPATDSLKITPAEEPAAQDLKGSGLILVVDDDSILLQTSKMILERNGYEVLTAANGKLALDVVDANKDRISAVILDLTMPVMGGEEALIHIEKIAPSLPVILSSGYDAAEAFSRFGEDRLAGSLQKPTSVTELLKTVKEVVRRHADERQQKSGG
jgi:two-component system CheB/CheR fusion protein